MTPRPVRVVVLSKRLTEEVGGPGVATVGFSRGMASLGASVSVLALEDCPGRWLVTPAQAKELGFEFTRVPGASFLASVWNLSRSTTASHQRSVVWVNGVWGPQSLAACVLAAQRQYPYVVRPAGSLGHAALRYRGTKKRLYYALVERRVLRAAAGIHCMSQDEADQLPGDLQKLAFVVPTGVDAPSKPTPGRSTIPTIGVLARLHPIKRHGLVLDAMEKLLPVHPDLQLEFAGSVTDRNYSEELRARVDGHPRLRERVRFLGHVASEDVPRVAGMWAAALLLSEQENFGHAVIAAAAAGTPTIVCPGVALAKRLESSGAGLVVAPEANAVAAAVHRLLSADRAALTTRCVEFAGEFSWDACSSLLLEELTRVAYA